MSTEAQRAYHRDWSARNKNKIRAYRETYIAKAGDKVVAGIERWRKANQARVNKKAAEWRVKNPEAHEIIQRRWRELHPAKIKARVARQRARRRNLKCTCCKPSDFHAVYDLALLIGGEVDHVRPLALGGPHCVCNLQVLTAEDHKAKTRLDKVAIRKARGK